MAGKLVSLITSATEGMETIKATAKKVAGWVDDHLSDIAAVATTVGTVSLTISKVIAVTPLMATPIGAGIAAVAGAVGVAAYGVQALAGGAALGTAISGKSLDGEETLSTEERLSRVLNGTINMVSGTLGAVSSFKACNKAISGLKSALKNPVSVSEAVKNTGTWAKETAKKAFDTVKKEFSNFKDSIKRAYNRKKYNTPNKIGNYGEELLKEEFGGSHETFATKYGDRVIDAYNVDANGIKYANESKTGRASLTKFIAKQIRKDAYLLKNGTIDVCRWVFYRSPVTGKVGASGKLMNRLLKKGITVIIKY